MLENALKRRLLDGDTLLGAFNNLNHPAVIEVLGLAGLDFVILDGEHSTLTPETAESLIRAAELRGLPTVTRVGENSPQVIQKFMDAGSQGVLTPMVSSEEEARRVVDAVKYPPTGKRGLAGARAADYAMAGKLGDYVAEANRETLVAVQIETLEAADRFDEIASVDEVDVLFFGPADLSSAMGVPGETRHPNVVSLIEELGKKTLAAGKVAGTIALDGESFVFWRERGFQWLCTGGAPLLARGIRDFRDEIERHG